MEVLYFILWLIVGLAAAFALVYIGLFFAELKRTARLFTDEVIPVIEKLDESLTVINEELNRVESAMEKIDEVAQKVNKVVKAFQEVFGPSAGRIARFSGAARKAISTLVKGK